ncbi:DUF3349 domain-containing protein [Arsenicicoccus dermatophilus]|uniref:DUF3349 domain-containing protein n=1 Tax=Arsenicicoccus dermatophilus TaxID=1076331 RepID=UPI001F4C922B|nr:DUF3349 domain-containing protein [Arsenicicoccus dermatophilus]MCH8611835.1 DUF3349 domain-containing protein [Arsenicicoccus dermatophilus]
MQSTVLTRIIDWLRAGYPQGVPQQDYIALFGILHRDLTEQEVLEVAEEMTRHREPGTQVSRAQIEERIRQAVHERPSAEDVQRVASRLAAGGWPLAPAEAASHSRDNSSTESI